MVSNFSMSNNTLSIFYVSVSQALPLGDSVVRGKTYQQLHQIAQILSLVLDFAFYPIQPRPDDNPLYENDRANHAHDRYHESPLVSSVSYVRESPDTNTGADIQGYDLHRSFHLAEVKSRPCLCVAARPIPKTETFPSIP
jgi:hypothetical protein